MGALVACSKCYQREEGEVAMEVLTFAMLRHVEGVLSRHTEMARWNINELGGLFFHAKFRFVL